MNTNTQKNRLASKSAARSVRIAVGSVTFETEVTFSEAIWVKGLPR